MFEEKVGLLAMRTVTLLAKPVDHEKQAQSDVPGRFVGRPLKLRAARQFEHSLFVPSALYLRGLRLTLGCETLGEKLAPAFPAAPP